MLISLQNNITIFAFPKTGTTAVETVLAPYCDIVLSGNPSVKHMPVRKFERFIRPYLASIDFERTETACVLREPLDWLGSWYRYRRRDGLRQRPNSTADVTFEEFVLAYMSPVPPPYAKVGCPAKFVSRKGGELGIDHLFRYDRFRTYLEFLQDRFSMHLQFEQKNVSPTGDLALTATTRNLVQEYLARDYEIFDSIR